MVSRITRSSAILVPRSKNPNKLVQKKRRAEPYIIT